MGGIDRKLNTLVLFSGGMDSTIALYVALDAARKNGGRVSALSFSYGQRHTTELFAAEKIIRAVASSELYGPVLHHYTTTRLHVPMFGSLTGGENVTKYETMQDVEELGHNDNAFVPYRHLLFFSAAAMFAHKWDCGLITTGLRGGFPDCTNEFEQKVQALLNDCVPDRPISIVTPTHATREHCLLYAALIPGCVDALGHTMTCFEGTSPPCGHCLPCMKRADGFAKTGLQDPITGPRRSGAGNPPRLVPRFDQ